MATAAPLPWQISNTTTFLEHAKSVVAEAFRIPSTRDLASIPARLAHKLDHTLAHTIPNFLVRLSGAEPWTAQAREGLDTYLAAGTRGVAADTAQAIGRQAAPVTSGWKFLLGKALQTGTFKLHTGMLSYLTSRWAFTCFTMALILNRVAVYGSTRQRITLNWTRRFALRLIPVMLFIAQIHKLLQAIQCQSSPDFGDLRSGHHNLSKVTSHGLDWQNQDDFYHWMSSSILFTASDADSCEARGMSAPSSGARPEFGSYSLLWPTFVRLCLSHLLETISCSLEQTPVMTEVAMSLFEHSLAFAEVEIMISQALGTTKSPRINKSSLPSNITEVPLSGVLLGLADATSSFSGAHWLNRMNVPIEVLLVALLSSCNALTSNVISILGKQRSLRLINTGFWACCFMASFVWAMTQESFLLRAVNGDIDSSRAVSSLLHFPTVVICGFVPHMIVLAGILCCSVIYLIALVLTASSLSSNPNIPRGTGVWDRLAIAHDNLQAAVQVRGINFKWHEDFYTALLRVGFTALTAASEAVFLNEGRSVEMRQFTWLEEERLDEIEASQSGATVWQQQTFQIAETYGVPPSLPWSTGEGTGWQSGYAKKRKLEKDKETGMDKIGENTIVYPQPGSGGVGAMQRTTRFYLLFIFMRGLFFLLYGYITFGIGVCLDYLGFTARPRWIQWLAGKRTRMETRAAERSEKRDLEFWLKDGNGKLAVPTRDDLDIVPEMRRRLLLEEEVDTESVLDDRVYGWFKIGGWFGTKDESTDYRPDNDEDMEDITSVISMATETTASDYGSDILDADEAWESEPEGQRTPTRHSPHPTMSEAATSDFDPDTTLDPATLARLLNPPNKAARDEARMLAAHLANPNRIVTRSTYRRELANEHSRVLLAGRNPGRSAPSISLYAEPNSTNMNHPLTPAEEAEVLETLILSRRRLKPRPSQSQQQSTAAPAPNNEDTDNADAFHAGGPSCVVCQASPRTIIAWPCRCLCVCEECRVNLALNNFANCITCRRQVGGFVRLWVP